MLLHHNQNTVHSTLTSNFSFSTIFAATSAAVPVSISVFFCFSGRYTRSSYRADPGGAADGLESDHRPQHFRGVATARLKLLNIVRPQLAWFGRKDAQQVAVVKQLVRDLNLDVEIRVVDTVRDADGLALSSRNALLSPKEREQALAIPRALATRDAAQARDILAAARLEPDIVEVADLDGPTLAIAARVGSVRLIDNIPLPEGDRS